MTDTGAPAPRRRRGRPGPAGPSEPGRRRDPPAPGPATPARRRYGRGTGQARAGARRATAPDAARRPGDEPARLSRWTPGPGQWWFTATGATIWPLMNALKADGYDLPVGVTGVDYLTHPGRDLPGGIRPERFEVVVELLSLAHRRRVRVRCQVPAQDPFVPSLFDLWPGTEAHERETYDMFGIRFAGHPDLSRILMPEDWEGHPLRKDYDTGHIPVQFKEAPR